MTGPLVLKRLKNGNLNFKLYGKEKYVTKMIIIIECLVELLKQ